MINAFAVVLLTLLGAAGEQLGYDRHLKTNTTRRRTHSLFRQGSMLYELMPNMTDFLLLPLIKRFAQMLAAQPLFAQMFGSSTSLVMMAGRCSPMASPKPSNAPSTQPVVSSFAS